MLNKLLMLLLLAVMSGRVFAQETKTIDYQSFDITQVGQSVPDFSFITIDGKKYQLSELRGRTVLLVFFATWCSPCMRELPLLEKEIWEKYRSENFMVVALGRDHSMEEIKEFNAKKGFTFELGPDPGHEIYGKFFKQYIPRNVLVDKNGIIIYQRQGYEEKDAAELIELIEKEIL
ncbi:MAG: TlpA disulfide reductase family protein [Bacteroidales bacterium]|nr:TlpA disulfide reductase family protein [Bacteroidales bacterium]